MTASRPSSSAPRVTRNFPIYGAPEETPAHPGARPGEDEAYTIKLRPPDTPSSRIWQMPPSAYWGDKPIWYGAISLHTP